MARPFSSILDLSAGILFILVAWLLPAPHALAKYMRSESALLGGAVCVSGPENALPNIIQSLRNAGGLAERKPDRDGHCRNERFPFSIEVPEGLEAWTVETLRSQGYAGVTYGLGTAGGSGGIRVAFDLPDILSERPTPQNFARLINEVQCKLRTRYRQYANNVSFKTGPGVNWPAQDFCWDMTISGHTATSAAFNSANLASRISNRYWFRSNFEIYFSHFSSFFEDEKNLGPKLLMHVEVISSQFARLPPSQTPEPSQFHAIDHFEPGSSVDELDGEINGQAVELLKSTPLICSSP
jgi:hypothetical protein